VAAERRDEPAITLEEMKKQIRTPDQHISRPTG
jgi:hypothetical protein